MKRLFLGVLAIVIGIVIGLPLLLYLLQDRLIFIPQPMTREEYAAVRRAIPGVTEVEIPVAADLRVRGWLSPSSSAGPAPLVIYFGGNAEEVSWMLPLKRHFEGYSLLLLDYRGYGRSDGRPSEAALFHDALAGYDRFAASPDVDRSRIVAIGRSLGSGVAVYLASMRPVSSLVLITPLDSVPRIAREEYPFLPGGWLIRHKFDSLSRAPRLSTPALFLAAERDRTVPPSHARALFDAWGGLKEWHLIPRVDHNTIVDSDETWERVHEFLANRLQTK